MAIQMYKLIHPGDKFIFYLVKFTYDSIFRPVNTTIIYGRPEVDEQPPLHHPQPGQQPPLHPPQSGQQLPLHNPQPGQQQQRSRSSRVQQIRPRQQQDLLNLIVNTINNIKQEPVDK